MTTTASPSAGGRPTAQASQPNLVQPGGASPFDKAAPEGSAQTVSQVLGEIVWLMSQSTMHKQFVVADLESPVAAATSKWAS